MNSESGNLFARQLLMEYIQQNKLLQCPLENIPNAINQIANASNVIYNAVEAEYHNIKCLR